MRPAGPALRSTDRNYTAARSGASAGCTAGRSAVDCYDFRSLWNLELTNLVKQAKFLRLIGEERAMLQNQLACLIERL